MKYLNAILLVLSIIIASTLLMQKNPWVFICAYWLVTVIKNSATK